MILFDTCVISEVIQPYPSKAVLAWIETVPEHQVYIPSLVIAEITRGVQRLPKSHKRDALQVWSEQLVDRFEGKILSFDQHTARHWALLTTNLESKGKTIPLMDGLLASLALQHSALFATRNTAHFEALGIQLLNPWEYLE